MRAAPLASHERTDTGLQRVRGWFARRGWTPRRFQELAWRAFADGHQGIIQVPTGAGKTYAAFGGPLADLVDRPPAALAVLYLTPLRAVARDIELALRTLAEDLAPDLRVESRTGDTARGVRTRQDTRLPHVLVTTPESLTLLLTRADAADRFAALRAVIVDEWHELLSTKRGTQTELALARLRALAPHTRVWALSATLSNLDEAARALVGPDPPPPVIVREAIDRPVIIRTLFPREVEAFPWAGRLGLAMLQQTVDALDIERSTLVFTNTRSQAERWFRAIAFARPDWEDRMALHHGSIDRDERERVESGVKAGDIRLVVCTSSLDLGVDFAPVDRVVQIGSPKGIARLMQRAGRASHRPGAPCEILCVPTHGLEMLEVAAVRLAIERGEIEPRRPLARPLDVLAQHMVSCALGGGFDDDRLYREVRSTWSYRHLTREEFDWALRLVREGGGTLAAYPEFNKVARDARGINIVPDRRVAHLHRMNVGTICGDGTVQLRYVSGRSLGSIEESFVGHLQPGDVFFFAGKTLEFVRLHDLVATVRPSRRRTSLTPIWSGTRLPISESLSASLRDVVERAGDLHARDDAADPAHPELDRAGPIVRAQAALSIVPRAGETLVEILRSPEGDHLFVYPFEGRLVCGGMAAIVALRLARTTPATFGLTADDTGFELVCGDGFDFESHLAPALFSADALAADAVESVNLSQLARSQFREIARVAGLIHPTRPGVRASTRQLQASSSLIYDVLREFDPGNLLLEQARREVLDRHFERSRLGRTMARISGGPIRVVRIARPTPLAFPLIAQRIGASELSTESVARRIDRMRGAWTTAAR